MLVSDGIFFCGHLLLLRFHKFVLVQNAFKLSKFPNLVWFKMLSSYQNSYLGEDQLNGIGLKAQAKEFENGAISDN